MTKEVRIFRLTLLIVAILVFGGMAWINAGAWLAVALAIGGSAFAGRDCAPRLPNRERA